ncbi:MAG: STAS/SEC14 domain-containing protein [Planctomycetia bacterium]|nr:STAS/SEC14 domain-containing protein [Planctomycetia bacterium]
MTVELREDAANKTLVVRASGKLSKQDYERFGPEVERLIKSHGKVRILFEMQDFHGWEMGALWEDIKFDVKHFRDIEKLAVVGESKWQEGMAKFCKPFTSATIKYFDHAEADEAKKWLAS